MSDTRCPLAVVTGASSGIGQAMANELVAHGVEVIALARRFEPTRPKLTGAPGLVPVGVDVSDERAVMAALEGLPAAEWVVCAAGGGAFGPAVDGSATQLRTLLETHVVGTYAVVRALMPAMQVARRGRIVVIGSIAERTPLPDCALYAAAKAGQAALMRSIGEEARPFGVRVCIARVGAVDTAIWESRPGFDRSKMMKAGDIARILRSAVAVEGAAVEELMILPPDGVMRPADA